jgi:WD repeat-containing protein 19
MRVVTLVVAAEGVKVPRSLVSTLELLHSYLLGKRLVRQGDHEGAARVLLRCVGDLSKFSTNATPLLTTTVIECHRSGLKRTAYEHARILMGDEYKGKVDEKLQRKIEALVRRPNKSEKEEEESPCPVCGFSLGCWQLDCPSCRTHLPFCVVTGRHMTLDDWSSCPRCHWPALYSQLGRMVETDPECPMCEQTVARGTPQLARDPAAELRKWIGAETASDGPSASSGAAAADVGPSVASSSRAGASRAALGALGLE